MKLLLFVFVISSLCYVNALKCTCNTNESTCKMQVCEGAFCYKRETQAEGKTTISKGCDPAGANTCTGVSLLGYGAGQCQCNTNDFCNSAPHSRPLTMMAIGCVFLLSFLFQYL